MIVSALILSSMYLAFAAYNGTAVVKRVVSTQATSTSVFSSNYMEIYSSSSTTVKNLRTVNEGNFVCPVAVCNYDQLDPTSPAHGTINYTFTAELVRYDSNTDSYVRVTEVQTKENDAVKTFYVRKVMDDNVSIDTDTEHSLNFIDSENSSNSFSYTYSSQSLAGENSYRDTYNICFDASEVALDVPNLYIRVTATPTEESVQLNSGISVLTSVISISQGRTVETGWHGSLQELSNTDYDGYNLIIEGSGSGTIDIVWDASKFTMNPVFEAKYDGTTGTGILGDETVVSGKNKRTLTVNSATGDNRYVIQFYKNDSEVYYMGPEFPSKYIYCENYIQDDDE